MRKFSILSLSALTIVGSTLLIQAQTLKKVVPNSGITISYNKDNSISRVDVVFSKNHTLDSLIDIRKRLAKLEITLDYTFLEFNKNGGLSGIGCSITNDANGVAHKGSFKMPFIRPEHAPGLYYDYSKNAERPFCAGACWAELNLGPDSK